MVASSQNMAQTSQCHLRNGFSLGCTITHINFKSSPGILEELTCFYNFVQNNREERHFLTASTNFEPTSSDGMPPKFLPCLLTTKIKNPWRGNDQNHPQPTWQSLFPCCNWIILIEGGIGIQNNQQSTNNNIMTFSLHSASQQHDSASQHQQSHPTYVLF